MNPLYLMVIRNTATHIRAQVEGQAAHVDAFEAARIIGIGWAKLTEDVLEDLLNVDVPKEAIDTRARDLRREALNPTPLDR